MELSKEWEYLIDSIKREKCLPFLGAGAATPFLPLAKDLANTLAIEYEYPMDDIYSLSKVSEFLSILENDKIYPKKLICKKFNDYNIPDFRSEKFVNHPYSILADINFPIYMTTNYDKLMEEALKNKGRHPHSEYLRWNEFLEKEYGEKSLFEDSQYKPSVKEPLVFHLHGLIDYPYSILLTESDYIEFLTTLVGNGMDKFLPRLIKMALASMSLLFIGYSLEDINLTILLKFFSYTNSDKSHIAVFPHFKIDEEWRKDKIQKYYEKYIFNKFKIRIFWSTAQEFNTELYKRVKRNNNQDSPDIQEKRSINTNEQRKKILYYTSDGKPVYN